MQEYKIYALWDPTTLQIRYIGKTVSTLAKRLSAHFKDKVVSHKTYWINKLKVSNLRPIISLIEVCKEDNWQDRERYWIAFYKTINKLTNYLDGGQGLPKGYKHSEQTIDKIKIASLKPNKGKFIKGQSLPNRDLAIENTKKSILQYDLKGNFISEYKGVKDIALKLNISASGITGVLKNRNKQSGGYIWKYKTDNYSLTINP